MIRRQLPGPPQFRDQVDAVMVAIEEHGHDSDLDTWNTILRIEANMLGERLLRFRPLAVRKQLEIVR